MFTIDRDKVELKTKNINSKSEFIESDRECEDLFKNSIWNIIDTVKKFDIYELSQWINFTDRWIHNRNANNVATYQRGEIIYADLGAENFRFEPSFTHPCVVIKNRKTKILVAPCSSKKFGRGFTDIIDARVSDGFAKNTGIQIEEFRWVNKNRVISKVGKVSPRILEEINKHMLALVPSYKREKAKLKALSEEKEMLIREKDALIQEKNALEILVQTLQNEIKNLKNEDVLKEDCE